MSVCQLSVNDSDGVSVSIGFASVDGDHPREPEALLNEADITLYRVKNAGGNGAGSAEAEAAA